eukprot:4528622-Alexandrium_andersonii.AAC.1
MSVLLALVPECASALVLVCVLACARACACAHAHEYHCTRLLMCMCVCARVPVHSCAYASEPGQRFIESAQMLPTCRQK